METYQSILAAFHGGDKDREVTGAVVLDGSTGGTTSLEYARAAYEHAGSPDPVGGFVDEECLSDEESHNAALEETFDMLEGETGYTYFFHPDNPGCLMVEYDPRKFALAVVLGDSPALIEEGYEDTDYEHGSGEYLVLTDDEADERAAECVLESLWACNASFLSGETGLPEEAFKFAEEMCEGANDAIEAMVKATCGLDKLVAVAIGCDGRGHFLSGYDGNESEAGDYYIYRTN